MNNELDWDKFSILYKEYLKDNFESYNPSFHDEDLTKQVNAYKQSIKDGHGVIVIAHSQGNYFTNEAYEKLDDWMKDYFHMFGVATPANHVAGFIVGDITAPYVKFHNDFINVVLTGLSSNRKDTHHQGFPSVEAHDFYNSYMTNEETKNDITNFIKTKLDKHIKAITQWKTKEELNYGTKKYRQKLEHRFDSSVIVDAEVYPFDPGEKLYFITTSEQSNIEGYVKASFGGTQILDDWEGQKIGQFYKLEGTDPVEYIEFTCKDPSTFEILSHQNINTKEWRVTVKNKDTNETQEGVYPFNLKGSLYELESGRWVLASCGGESIEEIWDGQQPIEYLRLKGTGEILYADNLQFEKKVKYYLQIGIINGIIALRKHYYGGIKGHGQDARHITPYYGGGWHSISTSIDIFTNPSGIIRYYTPVSGKIDTHNPSLYGDYYKRYTKAIFINRVDYTHCNSLSYPLATAEYKLNNDEYKMHPDVAFALSQACGGRRWNKHGWLYEIGETYKAKIIDVNLPFNLNILEAFKRFIGESKKLAGSKLAGSGIYF